jgi:SAM-dependent methyltransferase
MIGSLLRFRSNPRVQAVERVARRLGPIDRLARSAYAHHKTRTLARVTRDPSILQAVLGHRQLPAGYGQGMDERVVEYPWVLARVPHGEARLLDAGSTLNFPWVADHPALLDKSVVVLTLAPEGVLGRRSFSYLYGDLRDTLLRDACMDAVVCLSTLEHVGMDNRAYTGDPGDAAHDPRAFRDALREIRRILRPGGLLLLTVPFGQSQDLGWLQQFDQDGLAEIRAAFGGNVREQHHFLHRPGAGWQRAEASECERARFLQRDEAEGTMETRASAVACLALEKPHVDP